MGSLIEGERAREPRGAHPALTLHSPVAHPAREVGVLKRYGVGEREGERGRDCGSLVLAKIDSVV